MTDFLSNMKKLFMILCLLAGTYQSFATHIIGGELNYTCLGNNKYEITLYVYRDCYFGQAPFDSPGCVGIFDNAGTLLDQLSMKFNGKTDTIFNQDPCLFNPPSVCVERYIYKDTVELPFINGGYTIAYQRCCRNQTITNIESPLEKGATYEIKLTEDALKDCNSSPKFKEWPPVFICVNTPLIFDHSAVDIDGDSLVYKLCTPYDGGVYILNPKPCPPFAPSTYLPIVWKAPFGLSNMLGHVTGKDDTLRIGLHDGQMYAVPPLVGQFVVGVCIEEYRHGILYSTVKRDFQYNVVLCGIVEALFEPDDSTKCGIKTVSFFNQSTNSTKFNWTYKDLYKGSGALVPFSNIKEPIYTFPDTGSYRVCLVVEPGSVCVDSTCKTIRIQDNTLKADYDFSITNCIDSLTINAFDKSIDEGGNSPVIKWNWILTSNNGVQTSTLKNPVFHLPQSTEVNLQLISETFNGCLDTIFKTFQANILKLDTLAADTLDICKYEAVYLNPDFIPEYTYQWTDTLGLLPSCGCTGNPLASPPKTTVYTMSYTDSTGLCHVMQDITVLVLRGVDSFDFKIKVESCTDSIKIVIDDVTINAPPQTGPLTWEWVLTSPFGTLTSTDPTPTFTIPGAGFVTITGVATSLDSCKFQRKRSFQANVITNPPLSDKYKICQGDTIALYPGADPGWNYKWTPNFHLTPGNLVPNPLASPPVSTLYTVMFTDSVGLCVVSDSVLVVVLDSTPKLNFTFDIQCDGLKVNFTNTSTPGIGNFMWMFGDPDNSTSTDINPMFIYKDFGTYQVTLSTKDTNICVTSVTHEVMTMPPTFAPDFKYDIISCSNTLEVQFTDLSTSKYGNATAWEWLVNNVQFSTLQNPIYTFPGKGTYNVTLNVTFDNLCDTTITKEVIVDVIDVNIVDTVYSCFNKPVALNPGGNTSYTYHWEPCTAGLSDCNIANPIASPPFAPAYYVTITYTLTNGFICTLLDTVYVKLDDFFPTATSDTTTCLNKITLNLLNASNAQSVEWKTIKGTVLGSGNPFEVSINGTDTIVVYATSKRGCVFIDTIIVTQPLGLPPIDITVSNDTFCTPETFQLTATFNQDYTYKWTPAATLNFDNIFNPIASPIETTTYTVVVTDHNGCTGTASATIVKYCAMCTEPFIFIPNAFSPNGDNVNDILFVKGDEIIESMELKVFNRWGQEVFSSKDKNVGWDGTFRGEKLDPDVYAFILNIVCIDGAKFIKKGNITIIR
ncbi:MAG TPA: gliding motility-associated C-terminal domain-containing protein [Saprospiraceae bacterium]|nr:gliding motility-associated C-terminal domain-containing protein [Saprospiraceae bacterium]